MILEGLEEFFEDLDLDGPTHAQLKEMYSVYKKEICTIKFKDESIIVNSKRSKHYLCRGMDQTFEHIITRKNNHSGKRDFDPQRANRIHWIKPIIENFNKAEINFFEEKNDKGQLQYFFHYYDRDFIVILRDLPNGRILITSYYIDNYNRNYYKRKYDKYRK